VSGFLPLPFRHCYPKWHICACCSMPLREMSKGNR
jgi:hypothetical protein